jgi:two-component system, OmpR family, sensor kinase
LSRLPLKLKLTLAFAGVMALVLVATGLFLQLRLEAELDRSIDRGLRSQADHVSVLVHQAGSGLRERGGSGLVERDERLAQILDADGRVVDASIGSGGRAALTSDEIARARTETIFVDERPLLGTQQEPARLLATPVRTDDGLRIVVVGTSLEERDEALSDLGTLLLIGGPIALLLASLAGYGVASASLRPVESMRRRAAAISGAEAGRRLPVPPANDEIGRLGQTLNDMLARLEGALKREQTFVSDASHELRTPLAILKTELELALRKGRSREQLEAALLSATEETDRIAQLADDLLLIARSDQGELPVRATELDVRELFEDARDRFEVRSRELQRPVVIDAPAGLHLLADPLRMKQALGNMVDNALRYGDGDVELSARESNGRVELHVRDAGPGFPPEFIASAFERFSRAEEGRTGGGTGLGLAIVKGIARAHQGRARAANQPGGGADVWLELPRP